MHGPGLFTHNLFSLPNAGCCEILSFHPRCSKELLINFYSTIISTPSDSHRAVPSYRVAGPLSLKTMIFLSYSLCPALEGNSDSVHAASPHSHIYICWSSFGLCSPRAGDADPICLISSKPLDSCPHLPLPPGVHDQLGWVLNKQQMRAWSRNHKYCLEPEVRAMAGICFYPFSEIPQLLTSSEWIRV